VTGVIKNSP
jgi:hypothetical protein